MLASPHVKAGPSGPQPAEHRRAASPTAPQASGTGLAQTAYRLQRSIGNQAFGALIARHDGPGRPLDAAARAMFEPRFGVSLAAVRVHDDAAAAVAARALDARAFTVGHHVVFGAGAYAPDRPDGRATLAHELAHVVQQRGAPASRARGLSSPSDPAELEADAVAAAAGRDAHGPLHVGARAPAGVLHRQHVHMASGRFVGDVPGPDNNLREEVVEVIDKLANIGVMVPADYNVEYPAVTALPAAASVPVGTIPRTIAGIKAAEDPVLDTSSASAQLGLTLSADVGKGQPNATPDILALQDQLHQDWHLSNTDYATERGAVTALAASTVPDATIPRTIAGISEQKVAILAGQTGKAYRTQLAATVKMQGLVGSTATWVPSGPGSGDTFEKWASAATEAAAGPLPSILAATINCWEMVIVSALQAKLIDWKWVHKLYTSSLGAGWGSFLVSTLTRGARAPYKVKDKDSPRPNAGQIVFFNGSAHVAMANGMLDGTAPVPRAQIYTFWPPPGQASIPGTQDKVKVSTIEELSDFMAPIWGAPVVEIARPPW
jgi:hypothetical protein